MARACAEHVSLSPDIEPHNYGEQRTGERDQDQVRVYPSVDDRADCSACKTQFKNIQGTLVSLLTDCGCERSQGRLVCFCRQGRAECKLIFLDRKRCSGREARNIAAAEAIFL